MLCSQSSKSRDSIQNVGLRRGFHCQRVFHRPSPQPGPLWRLFSIFESRGCECLEAVPSIVQFSAGRAGEMEVG